MTTVTTKNLPYTQRPARSSQLDTLETSIHSGTPTSYAEFRRSRFKTEFECANELYEDMDHEDGKDRLSKLRECREFAYFARNSETGKVRVISNSCRLRWCPVCAEVRRIQIQRGVFEWLSHIRNPKFLTLTMSHDTLPLSDQIQSLYDAFRLFRRYKSLKTAVRGGIWFFQVKKSEIDNLWHPHLHICLDSDFIDKKLLSVEWLRATGNSYIIDIRKVENESEVSNYVARYSAQPCKMSSIPKGDRSEIANVLFGKRLFGKFGTGRKCCFISEGSKESSVWQRLGNWHDFIVNRPFFPAIQQIIKAWQNDVPIERDLCKDFIQKADPDPGPIITTVLKPKQQQLYIDDFVHR